MKRRFLGVILGTLLWQGALAAQEVLDQYTNPQFGFTFRYPNILVPGPERADGSGRDFQTPDGKFKVEVYAKAGGKGRHYLSERYHRELAWFGRAATYKVKKRGWYVVSGVRPDGTEFYSKGFTTGSVLTAFRITYPHGEHGTFDRWVEEIEKNFSSGPVGDRRVSTERTVSPSFQSTENQTASAPTPPLPPRQAAATHSSQPDNRQHAALPKGRLVRDKPGFVTSPYGKSTEFVDVRGYPSGTEVKDPYTGKLFLVP
jgi:hypothetical protein